MRDGRSIQIQLLSFFANPRPFDGTSGHPNLKSIGKKLGKRVASDSNDKTKRSLAFILLALAALSLALGAYYFTVDTSFLADDFGRHPTHGIAFTGLGILMAAGGFLLWPRKPKR